MKGSPYVGPRPYDRGDQKNFYGREREGRELQALLTAEREVLVYAASGAGKTSLFNARVIPALEEVGFVVPPVARVGMDLPPEVQPGEVDNIFLFSTLLSLAGDEADPRSVLGAQLTEYVKALMPGLVAERAARFALAAPLGLPVDGEELEEIEEVHPPILIFDQFEEIFTTHRERWEDAAGFFAQVRKLMDEIQGIGVVFSMREDHVAALDPYLHIFPNRLRARFRLEPLGRAGAIAAIARPAKNAGFPFAEGVAERLADDLRVIKVQAVENPADPPKGPFVEPVQLQVVCAQLWAHLPEGKTGEIQWDEVQKYGNVDLALTDFYETCVLRAAALLGGMVIPPEVPIEPGMPGMFLSPAHERKVRAWVGTQLITPVGTRGLALRGAAETAGLPNDAVDVLEDLHLVRPEVRAGARWYELAHDRLVDPILTSNRAWESSRETPLRTAARRWKETGDASLLYRGNALEEVKAMIQLQEDRPVTGFDFEPYEQEFYEASLIAEQAARQRRRRVLASIIGALILLALMIGLTVFAFDNQRSAQAAQREAEAQRSVAYTAQARAEEGQRRVEEQNELIETQKREAQEQAKRARGRELASYASNVLKQGAPQRSILLALQGLRRYQEGGGGVFVTGEQVLRDALHQTSGVPLRGQGARLFSLTPSPDGKWLAGESERGIIYLWYIPGGRLDLPKVLQVPAQTEFTYLTLAFSADSRWLSVSATETNYTWDLHDLDAQPRVYTADVAMEPKFLPGGRWMTAYDQDANLVLWDLEKGGPFEARVPFNRITYDVFVEDAGRWMLLSYEEIPDQPLSALLLNLQAADPLYGALNLPAAEGQLAAADFSPDGRWLVMALARADGGERLRFLDLSAADPLASPIDIPLDAAEATTVITFHADGEWLLVERENFNTGSGGVDLWDLRGGPAADLQPQRLFGGKGQLSFSQVVSSRDGCWLGVQTGNQARLYQVGRDGPVEKQVYDMKTSSFGMQFSYPDASGEVRYFSALDWSNQLNLVDLNPDGNQGSGCERPSFSVQQTGVEDLRAVPLGGLDAAVSAVTFLPTGWLAAMDANGDARLWQLPIQGTASSPEILHPAVPNFSPFNTRFFPLADGRSALMIANDAFYTWPLDANGGGMERLPVPSDMDLGTYETSPDGRWLVMQMRDGSLYLWDLARLGPGQVEPRLLMELGETPDWSDRLSPVAFGPDGTWLALTQAAYPGRLLRMALDDQGAPAGLETLYDLDDAHFFAELAINERWLAALVSPREGSLDDLQLYFWDMQDLRAAPLVYPAPQAGPFLRFSPDGAFLVPHTDDYTFSDVPIILESFSLRLWNVRGVGSGQTELPSLLIEHPSGRIDTSVVSPDGRWLVTNLEADNGSVLWSLDKLRQSNDPQPFAEFFSTTLLSDRSAAAVAFSPDGRRMAAMGNNVIYLWDFSDVGQGAVLLRPPAGHNLYGNLAFLRDGSALIALTEAGAMLRWPASVDELVPLACDLVGRELTAAEQQQWLQGETPLQICPP